MQALRIRALCRAPKLVSFTPISLTQQFALYRHNYMFSSAKQQPQSEMENRVFFSGEEDIQHGYREDMAESYGIAYATRCSDEGYGERYGESVSHGTRCFGEGYKEGYGESMTISSQIVGSEDIAKSFGLACATECFDEGYVEGYAEGIKVLGNQNVEKKDMAKSFELAYPARCLDKGYNGRHGDHNMDKEDMTEAFGLAYATRCSDEGYGERYGESTKVLRHRKNATEMEIEGHY